MRLLFLTLPAPAVFNELMIDVDAIVIFKSLHVLVVPLSDLKKTFETSDELGRSRSRVKTRVQIPLGPPPRACLAGAAQRGDSRDLGLPPSLPRMCRTRLVY